MLIMLLCSVNCFNIPYFPDYRLFKGWYFTLCGLHKEVPTIIHDHLTSLAWSLWSWYFTLDTRSYNKSYSNKRAYWQCVTHPGFRYLAGDTSKTWEFKLNLEEKLCDWPMSGTRNFDFLLSANLLCACYLRKQLFQPEHAPADYNLKNMI